MKTRKSIRVLFLYESLLEGKIVNSVEMAGKFGVDSRTVHRDIAEIRNYLSEKVSQKGGYQEVVFDNEKSGYILKKEVAK